jgi:ATP-binding cassette subfamily F protein 3
MEAEAERVLKGLGFQDKDFTRLTQEFSGGWQMRIELAKMLLQRPDYLLLDEPTNHLDIESIIWLETWLAEYTGSIITISHDQQFLDNTTNRTVEVELGSLYDYKATYSKYLEQRAERREKLQSAFANQQKLIAQREKTINRFMAKATKTKMAQSMQKQLDKIERIELDDENSAAMNLRFPPAPRSGDVVLRAHGVHKKYGPLHVLRGVDLQIDRGDRLAFVGQNGQGKTTLAKILIDEVPASTGDVELGHNVSIGYYAQNQSDKLLPDLTLLETLEEASPPEMRTRLRAILGAFLFSGEDAEKKVVVLSGGERARLALAAMLLRPFNLLVLDEPTNHLDIISKNILKQALMEYDGTVIVVSHDREFLSGLTSRTIEFRDHRLFDHIGDVNAFLAKRQNQDMRDLAVSGPSAAPNHQVQTNGSAEAAKPALSYEERKRLLRDVSNAEKKIAKIEEKITKIEAKMADPAFYETGNAEATAIEHAQLQTQLEEAMTVWEEAQIHLETAEG